MFSVRETEFVGQLLEENDVFRLPHPMNSGRTPVSLRPLRPIVVSEGARQKVLRVHPVVVV